MAERHPKDTPRPARPTAAPPEAATPAVPDYARTAVMSRVSWGAVIAGTVVAIMANITLNLLGLAIGATALGPATEGAPFAEVGIFGLIWGVLSILVALFAGGWVAGRLAGIPRTFEGAIHGVLTWGLASFITLYLVTTAVGGIIGGAFGIIGQGAALAWQGVEAVAPRAVAAVDEAIDTRGVTMAEIRAEARDLQARVDDERLLGFFNSLVADEPVTPAEREAAVDALAQETELSRQEAEQTVDGWIATAEDVHQQIAAAERQVRQVGEELAAGVAEASFWAFLAFVLGAVVAAIGGRLGAPALAEAVRTR